MALGAYLMDVWLILFGMMVVTYGTRLSVMALLGHGGLPESVQRGLRFVPPAAFAAIVFPALLMPEGALDLSPGNLRLLAGIAAAGVAWRTRRTLLAIAAGMVILWLLQAVG